jgi:dTDP-glucose 4,6-dehydratase
MLDASFVAWSGYTAEKKKKFRFIHVSTDEVFGALGEEGVFDERTPYDPSSPYSATKAGSDHIARAWCRTYGMPVVVTNCSNNFGPSQHPEKFIPTVIRCAVTGAPIPLYGNGRNVRDWLFVEDHADGLLRAADSGKPGATYLFGGRAEFGNEDLCRMICRLLDAVTPSPYGRPYASQITYVAERPGHDFRYAIDPSAAERQLGWKAATSLEEGLTKTIEWYLRNPAWLIRHDGEFGRLGLARASQVKSEVG